MWDVVKHLTDCSFVMRIFSRHCPFEAFIVFCDDYLFIFIGFGFFETGYHSAAMAVLILNM